MYYRLVSVIMYTLIYYNMYYIYSKYAQYLISYRPPHRVMGEYGYAVEPVDQILTSMFGMFISYI